MKDNPNNDKRRSFLTTQRYPIITLGLGTASFCGAIVLHANYERRITFENDCPKYEECTYYQEQFSNPSTNNDELCDSLYHDMTKPRPAIIAPVGRSGQIVWEPEGPLPRGSQLYNLFRYMYNKECTQ